MNMLFFMEQWQVFDSQCQAASFSFLLAATASGVFSCKKNPFGPGGFLMQNLAFLETFVHDPSLVSLIRILAAAKMTRKEETSIKKFEQLMAKNRLAYYKSTPFLYMSSCPII